MDRMRSTHGPRHPRRPIGLGGAWLPAIAIGALVLSGCAATASESPADPPAQSAPQAPAPSHTMPDGTVMEGAEHGDHGDHEQGAAEQATDSQASDGQPGAEGTAQEPSHAATMICGGQVSTAAAVIFDLDAEPEPTSSWDAPTFTCTYEVDGAPVVLTVHDTADAAAGLEHFDATQRGLGAEEIEGMLGLGLPSFSTGDGVVGFLRDGRTLTVDATALPEGFGDGTRTADGAAYALASAVLTCWVEHD